jgi:hypothetical protein
VILTTGPACVETLKNLIFQIALLAKSLTMKAKGPLHPLPVPDEQGDTVAMDFIGPLPVDNGFDCILTITDTLGSDISTSATLMAEECAELFFTHWFCKNGLPKAINCDCDKLFISMFWCVLCKLTGIKLKMLSSYHSQTDGSSQHTNKSVNQCIRFHINCIQKGWVCTLLLICFQLMSTVNTSTGYMGFELCMGKSPRVIPHWEMDQVIEDELDLKDMVEKVTVMLERLRDDIEDAKDNLLTSKFQQAHYANKN